MYVPPVYTVYVLKSQHFDKHYIGCTTDLRRRLEEHNSGKNLSTKPFFPYNLLYFETFANKTDAKSREVYLKSGWEIRSLKKILKNSW